MHDQLILVISLENGLYSAQLKLRGREEDASFSKPTIENLVIRGFPRAIKNPLEGSRNGRSMVLAIRSGDDADAENSRN